MIIHYNFAALFHIESLHMLNLAPRLWIPTYVLMLVIRPHIHGGVGSEILAHVGNNLLLYS